jgi:hypothetical protein
VKLASFFVDGQERFGALLDGRVVDFTGDGGGSPNATRPQAFGLRELLV